MRLFAFAHHSPWPHPSPLSLLHGGHLIHGYPSTDLKRIKRCLTFGFFQLLSKIIYFRSLNPPSYFPHLSVKPALINDGIYPGASYKFVCTKSFKELSTSDWEPVCSKRASCKANRRGDPGGRWSVWMWLAEGGLPHPTLHPTEPTNCPINTSRRQLLLR